MLNNEYWKTRQRILGWGRDFKEAVMAKGSQRRGRNRTDTPGRGNIARKEKKCIQERSILRISNYIPKDWVTDIDCDSNEKKIF